MSGRLMGPLLRCSGLAVDDDGTVLGAVLVNGTAASRRWAARGSRSSSAIRTRPGSERAAAARARAGHARRAARRSGWRSRTATPRSACTRRTASPRSSTRSASTSERTRAPARPIRSRCMEGASHLAGSGWSCTRSGTYARRSRRSGAGATSTASTSSRCRSHGPGARRSPSPGDAASCDVIVALGGDGTTLAALRSGARRRQARARRRLRQPRRAHRGHARTDLDGRARPLRGGRLDAAPAARRWRSSARGAETLLGDQRPRRSCARAPARSSAEVRVDGELFIRFAGDGLVVAHAARLERLHARRRRPGARARRQRVSCSRRSRRTAAAARRSSPGRTAALEIELDPGHGGARIELDGQIRDRVEPLAPRTLRRRGCATDHATLVALGGEEPLLGGLRRRRVLMDSPRMLARDDREAAVDELRDRKPVSGYKGTHGPTRTGAAAARLDGGAGRRADAPPGGSPERRAGEDPWTGDGARERPRRISDDLAWLRQAIDEPETHGLRGLGDTAAVAAWEIDRRGRGAAGPPARAARARRRRIPAARLTRGR